MKARAYIAWMLSSGIVIAAACAGVAMVADPYRLFDSPAFPIKPAIYHQAVLAKTVQMERTRPRTLLLGNSRIEVGLDPESDAWPASWRPVFNGALAGRDLFTAYRLLQHVSATEPPQRIIVAVDVQDFIAAPMTGMPPPGPDERRLLVTREGEPNPVRRWQQARDLLSATLTLDALRDSVLTMLWQDRETGITMTRAGFNPLREYIRHVRTVGHHGLFTQKLTAYVRQYAGRPGPDFADPDAYQDFRTLRAILDFAARHRIEVVLLIHPYHADYLDVIRDAGLRDSFLAWKRALIRVVNESPAGERLIDFSQDSDYIREPVPPKGDMQTDMRWYWEPGHYKAALGELMIARIARAQGANFGMELNGATPMFRMSREEH